MGFYPRSYGRSEYHMTATAETRTTEEKSFKYRAARARYVHGGGFEASWSMS